MFDDMWKRADENKAQREAELASLEKRFPVVPSVGDRVLARAHLISSGYGLKGTFIEAHVIEIASAACKIEWEGDFEIGGDKMRRHWVPIAILSDILTPLEPKP